MDADGGKQGPRPWLGGSSGGPLGTRRDRRKLSLAALSLSCLVTFMEVVVECLSHGRSGG